MLSWVAMHRRHHELSDHEGDLHSPESAWRWPMFGRLRGFLHAHLTWMIEHDYPNVAHYVPDLMAERTLVAVNSYYYSWVLLGLLHPGRDRRAREREPLGRRDRSAVGRHRADVRGRADHVGDQFRHAYVRHAPVRHPRRQQPQSRHDGAGSAWGEGWHNNHHAFPYSAAFGLRWFEFDPGFLFIRLLEALGTGLGRQGPERRRRSRAGSCNTQLPRATPPDPRNSAKQHLPAQGD